MVQNNGRENWACSAVASFVFLGHLANKDIVESFDWQYRPHPPPPPGSKDTHYLTGTIGINTVKPDTNFY